MNWATRLAEMCPGPVATSMIAKKPLRQENIPPKLTFFPFVNSQFMHKLGVLKFTYVTWLSLTCDILSHKFRNQKQTDFSLSDINSQYTYEIA